MKKTRFMIALLLVMVFLFCTGCFSDTDRQTTENSGSNFITLEQVPEYSGQPYITVNKNIPGFTKEDLTTDSFEMYSQLDSLGRCGAAYANISSDLMPKKKGEALAKLNRQDGKPKDMIL